MSTPEENCKCNLAKKGLSYFGFIPMIDQEILMIDNILTIAESMEGFDKKYLVKFCQMYVTCNKERWTKIGDKTVEQVNSEGDHD